MYMIRGFHDANAPDYLTRTTIKSLPIDDARWINATSEVDYTNPDGRVILEDSIIVDKETTGADFNADRDGKFFLQGDAILGENSKYPPRELGKVGIMAVYYGQSNSKLYVADFRFATKPFPVEDFSDVPEGLYNRTNFEHWRSNFIPVSAFAYAEEDAISKSQYENYNLVGDPALEMAVKALCDKVMLSSIVGGGYKGYNNEASKSRLETGGIRDEINILSDTAADLILQYRRLQKDAAQDPAITKTSKKSIKKGRAIAKRIKKIEEKLDQEMHGGENHDKDANENE